MTRYIQHISIIAVVIASVFSCRTTINYSAPDIPITSNFSNKSEDTLTVADTNWWLLFNDTTLVTLINQGLENNYTIKSRLSALKQSQFSLDIAKSDLFPQVNYNIEGRLNKQPLNQSIVESLTAAAQVSYTVDLWGRIKNQNEAALQNYLATEMGVFQLQATLIAQIANLYFTLRDLDNKIIVTENTIEALSNFKSIISARYDGGFISKVDLNQNEIRIQDGQITLKSLYRTRKQIENAISIATGNTPQKITKGLKLQQQLFIDSIPTGVPLQLLKRRPSLNIAEYNLKAQLAKIGATEALKFPDLSLSLTGGAVFSNTTFGFSELLGNLIGPIFNSNKITNTIALENEIYQQLIYNYKQEYLIALQEVEDALIAKETYNQEFKIRIKQLDLADEALQLSWVRYNEGLTSFLDVLNVQQSLFNAQLQASESYAMYLQSVVKLYLALGGGWQQNNINSN